MARSVDAAMDDMLRLCVSGDISPGALKSNQIVIKRVQNMPIRGNVWPLQSAVVHAKKNIILLSDVRGEVYMCNFLSNKYHLIKLASSKLSTMCFLHGTNDLCLLAYENRDVLIVDMNKKAVVHQIDIPNSVLRLARCHPTKALVAMATDQQEIMIYDFGNSNQFCKLKELKCIENIVDIQFEHNGFLIAVTLQHSGTYFYGLSDYRLIVECPLPKSERKASWISYCCQVTPGSAGEDGTINMRIILGSADGKLYVWNALSVVADTSHPSQKAFLTGIVDLPVRYPLAIKIFTINVLTMYAARICVCSSNGEIAIIDINDSGLTTAGAWILAHTVEVDELHNVNHGITYAPYASRVNNALVTETDDGNKVFNAYDGMVHTNGKILVLVGCDGIARIINTNGFKLSYKGKLLHVRGPYPVVEIAETATVKPMTKSKKSSALASSVSFNPPTRDLSGQYIRERENIAKVGNVNVSPRDDIAKIPTGIKENMSLPTPPPPTYKDTYSGDIIASSKPSQFYRSSIPALATMHTDSTVDVNSSTAVGATSGHLFELSGLTPEETIVNENKLREFLAAFGEYPERYRGLIWQFLLKLPGNSSEYDRLADLGVHHKYDRFYLSYSMKTHSHYERLKMLCSILSHWAPPLGHASYLPQLVFPFQMLFPDDKDNISVVEIMISFMMWYGFSWHIAYPDDPILIIESLNDILKLHDTKLHYHFDRLDVSVGKIGWRMISTGFSEILSRSNWLKLFDFLFTNIHIPEYIMLVPIAIMRIVRSSFFHISTEEHITAYFSHQQTISMKDVVMLCVEMHSGTPPRYFIALTSPDQLKLKQSLQHTDDDGESKTANRPAHSIDTESLSGPLFPLPSGRYPAYDGYPKFLLEWEEKNDMEEAELKSELLRKELILKDIQHSIAQIDADHELWMSRHQASVDSERRHKLEMIENEKKTMDTLQKMEEKISKQRLSALAIIETVTQQEIEAMSQVENETKLLTDATSRHHNDKINFVENMAKHRLLAAQAELASEERYHKLHTRRVRDNLLRSIGDTINSKVEEMESTKEKLNLTWVVEDEELRAQWNKKLEKIQEFNENMSVKRLEKEMSVRLKELEVVNRIEVLNLSNQRERREIMDKASSEEENRIMALPSVDDMTTFIETQLALDSENGVVAAQRKLMTLVDEIKGISNNLIANETIFLQKYEEEKLHLLKSELKKQWTDRLGLQLQSIMKAISILQENMVLLKFSALKIDYHNKNVENTVNILKNVTSSATVNESQINRLGHDIINRQRERFNEMHQALLSLISASSASVPLNTHGSTDDFTASMNELLLPLGETVSKVSSRLLLSKPAGKVRSDSSGSEGPVNIDHLIQEPMRQKSKGGNNKSKVTRGDEGLFVDATLDRSIDNDATLWGGGSSSDDNK